MSGDSVAQDQIKAFVERILRMKEERKAIDADIREIYAEAKGSGFDKTVLGKLVNYVEKRAADANAVMESESLFDLYLSAYDSASGRVGTVRATHTHEAKSEPQPTKAAGQVDQPAPVAISGGRVATTSSVENEAAEISTPITEQQDTPHPASDLTATPKPPQGRVAPIQPEAATSFADAEAHGAEANDSDSNAVANVPATNDGNANIGGDHEVPAYSEPVINPGRHQPANASDVAQTGDEHQRTVSTDTNEAPVGRVADESPAPLSFADKIKRLRPNCQHPQACRSSGGKAHCGRCDRAAETGSAA